MTEKSKIIMVAPFQNSFIQNDFEILSSQYDVLEIKHRWQNKYFTPLFLVLQFFEILLKIYHVKAIIIEFGGYWAVIPSIFGRLFRIPVYIILHGADCAKLPTVHYGSLRKKLIRLACEISYKYASLLLPVSESLIYTKNHYNTNDVYQGVKHHLPKIKTAYHVIHNGLDIDFWTPSQKTAKDKTRFIAVFSPSQFLLKGGDLILFLARKFSDYNFYIAGMEAPLAYGEIPNNLKFLGRLSKKELRDEYRKAQFHFQLSMFEGFGLALCEAMLCECIPIGSSVNMIPEIIGDSGFILNKKDENKLATIVENALLLNNKKELGLQARKRINDNYPLEKRKQLLLETIK